MNTLEKLKERAPDLEFELPDGTLVVRLGLIITLYFKEGYTTETKKLINECFERYHEEFQRELKSMVFRRHKKITPDNFVKACKQVVDTEPNDQFSWFIGSSKSSSQAGSYSLSMLNSFEIHGDKLRSYIKLVIPWNNLAEAGGVESYQQWLVYLCNQVKAEHGYGGLSSVLPFDYDNYMPMEFQLAQNYSGLMVDSVPFADTLRLQEHIKGVNWFTVLGNTYVERLGGEASIRHALSGRGDIEISNYDHGLIIRAGQYPELGAVEDGPPAAYVAVNKVVKPVRIPNPDQLHSYSPYGDCFDEESTARWYARFDQPESAQATPERIPAGQPCTHAGYWFSPAQANSRRYFAQGEIMPRFDQSSWGETLWYWSAEG